MTSMFVVAMMDGSTNIIKSATALPLTKGQQPKAGSEPQNFFFFVAFVVVLTYVLLNLFVGIVFYQFSRIRLFSQTGSAFLADSQKEWCAVRAVS